MGIDTINKISIIRRILFAVTLFQQERGQHHQQHLGTLAGISINHQNFFSSSIEETTKHKVWSIININTRLRVFITRLVSQHEVGYTISSA
jgi:hypothetical protein